MKKPTTKQLVVFSIMMQKGEGIMSKAPSYITEKMEKAFKYEHPENFLDSEGTKIFEDYTKHWEGYIRD